ncbi:hypothetical protein [Bifidobacterium callitrichos]|uniref:Uncharacterized protein n=1 Tax=Bifidobacterium callitrichos DSM 23973 TaxID=1437609 RepID=A0A087ACT8_9BIFI|nr:hypothetical protein [Bifidobacterium callitrichos]KFI56588.1 hypothetical protein BCAL_0185 [Bifidobacterium callitrichos DSM 23973]
MVVSHVWRTGDVITSVRLNSLESRALDSVPAMASAGLTSGDVVATRGWATPGDGGAAAYDIRARQANDQLDGWRLIAVGDTLTAVLRIPQDMDCRIAGIFPNMDTDISGRLNKLFAMLVEGDNTSRPVVRMPSGSYRCDSPITMGTGTRLVGEYPPVGWSQGVRVPGTKLNFAHATFTGVACVTGDEIEGVWINCGACTIKDDRTKLRPGDSASDYGGWSVETVIRSNVDGLRVGIGAHRVVVTGASRTGYVVGTAKDLTNCAAYECHTGFDIGNDCIIYGLYGFNLETFIRLSGAISTLIGVRCDSVHGDAIIFDGFAETFTLIGVNLDWVGGAAIRFGDSAVGNMVVALSCSRVAAHGSSLQNALPLPGYGCVRFQGGASGNTVSMLTGRDTILDHPVEGIPDYKSPAIPVLCDNTADGTTNLIELRGGPYGMFETEGYENPVATKVSGSTNSGSLVIDNGLTRRTIKLNTI